MRSAVSLIAPVYLSTGSIAIEWKNSQTLVLKGIWRCFCRLGELDCEAEVPLQNLIEWFKINALVPNRLIHACYAVEAHFESFGSRRPIRQ